MQIKKKNRKFKPLKNSNLVIKDCAEIILSDNEQVTFTNKSRTVNYDLTKKDWGYYATPSINGRLKKNNFQTYIVKNESTKLFFIFLVKSKKKKFFLKYLKSENLIIVSWPKSLLK